MNEVRRYTSLDGLRGVAAIVVVAFHAHMMFGSFYPKSAYLAVDFFFLLSGFVIAHAYDKRMSSGLTGWSFFRARLLRLYPLYIAGMAITAAAVAVALFVKHDASQWSVASFGEAIAFGLFFLPVVGGANIFPLNAPAWSLFYELVVNAAYAARIFSRKRILAAVIVVSAVGIVFQAVAFGGCDQGAFWPSTGWALFRAFFGFPLGVALYHAHDRLPAIGFPAPLLGSMLLLLLCVDLNGGYRTAFDTIFVLLLSPLIVLVGSVSEPRTKMMATAYELLGFISYPLYVLHLPLLAIVLGIMRRRGADEIWTPWAGFGILAAMSAVAIVAGFLDARLRRGLTHWLRRWAPRPLDPIDAVAGRAE